MRSIVSAIVVFLALNGLLWVGQEIYHREDVAEAERLEESLASLEAELDEKEAWFAERLAESDAMDALAQRLEDPQQFATEVEYQQQIDRYNAWAVLWNAAVPRLEQARAEYDSALARYNAMVEEYNNVAEAAYARWWLLPIPLGRQAARAVR